jgi:hypothetical protein
MHKNWFMILCLGICTPLFAQQATPNKQAPVQLTELEATKLELLNTQLNLVNKTAQEVVNKKKALIEQIIQEHPGYTWGGNPKTGEEGLTPLPTPEVKNPPVGKPKH